MSSSACPIVLAPVFGPTLGGLLLQDAGWQWIFMINVPVGALALVLALRLLPHDEAGTEQAGRLDVHRAGARGRRHRRHHLRPVAERVGRQPDRLVGAAAGARRPRAAGAVRASARGASSNPLLDLRLFANRAFSAASLVTFCLGAALFGAMILMPLYFQDVRGQDAIQTGLLLIPQGIGGGLGMALSGRLTERLGGGRTSLIGGLILLLATSSVRC